jgi:polysaccharide export outer membrane protein
VLPSDLIQVSGAVKSPGPYAVGRNMTLSKAIAIAGGLARDADPSTVEIQRRMGSENRSRTVDFSQVQSGKIDDPTLRSGDEVVVRKK